MALKRLILALFIIVSISTKVSADEGMWIPILLEKYNYADMKAKGFKLTPEDIYSVNHSSMKDAVVIFGRGCTGELISDQGLLITNHHCGYGQIQAHSSVDHDYLTDGFWAYNKSEELVNPGLTVTFLVSMEEITEQVLDGTNENMSEPEINAIIEQNISKLKAEAVEGTHYSAVIKPFFSGNNYYLFINEVYKDIRLVGTPPSAIGKFGGDTDNWMWPRHTGDFSMFRIYADKNNQPAEYSKDNVPYKPKRHFPVSIKGVEKGDFTMVFGYPGKTEEYLPSYAVEYITQFKNPNIINLREQKLNIIKADMETSAKIRIQYSSKAAGVANGWKKWIGENRGLKRLDAIAKKQELEKEFTNWVNDDETRIAKYDSILPNYAKLYKEFTPYSVTQNYIFEGAFGIELTDFMWEFMALEHSTDENREQILNRLQGKTNAHFKNYNAPTDKKIFAKLWQIYADSVDADYYPDFINIVNKKYKGDYNKYADYIYSKSIFTDKARTEEFLNNYSEKKLINDPAYKILVNVMNIYRNKVGIHTKHIQEQITSLDKQYMKAILDYRKGENLYPDANFTLRIAYGNVDTYNPKDAVKYEYFTTLDGIIAKDNPDIYDYRVPTKLKGLYENKDYSQYADKDGKMHVCFIATNHTTGGNSGSPVINGNGELIGVNFDRNWEGTMSDIMYDPDQCRNITLDIRYALFIVDKFAGAHNLIEEMTIVK